MVEFILIFMLMLLLVSGMVMLIPRAVVEESVFLGSIPGLDSWTRFLGSILEQVAIDSRNSDS